MDTTRILRKTAPGQYDVLVNDWTIGHVEHHDGRYAAFGAGDLYGYKRDEAQFLGWTGNLPAAGRLVADNEDALDRERAAQHESEMLAELGSGWVHSGGNPADAMTYAHQALAEMRGEA
jgi:hypothetical protein